MELLNPKPPPRVRWHVVRFGVALLLGGLLPGVAPLRATAESSISGEYQLKAVFLFNFAQFVEWPPETFPDAQSPIIIGILGEDPFGAYLDELVRGEKIRERPLLVRRFKTPETITACHLLFVSRSDAALVERTLRVLQQRSVLTLSDADGFTRAGGMVRFATENGKIRLKINLGAAKACGLRISSKIIRPATIVATGQD